MMQFNKINFLLGVNDFEIIDKGYSGATKYLFTKNNKLYFLKIGKLKITDNIETLLHSCGISHPTIIDYGKLDNDQSYIIEEFESGKDLKDELNNYDLKFIYEFGFEIGMQYRTLRSIYPDIPMTKEKFEEYRDNVKERIADLKVTMNNSKLSKDDCQFINYIISFLTKNINLIKNSFLVFGHTDIKLSNYLIVDKKIVATDVEHTAYKELSLSMVWTFARADYQDEKNLAFARGYLDALYNFKIPQAILACFNYTYLYNMAGIISSYIEKEDYKKITQLINHIKNNYVLNGEIITSNKLNSKINISTISLINNSNITLVKGSYDPYNLTFKCQKAQEVYFLKVMAMSDKHFNKAIETYKLLNKLAIPIPSIIDFGVILKNQYYYLISKFIELKEMNTSLDKTFATGFKMGNLVASYLIKLKKNKIKNADIYTKDNLYNAMLNDIEYIYGNNEYSKYLHWSKKDIINYLDRYITSFNNEQIDLINGDIKFGNILYNVKSIYFVDNESFKYSYDIINFMYNIHIGFLEEEDLCYKGFVNGYIKYMNAGIIPDRIQNQAKLLLIYYVIRIVKDAVDNKNDITKLKFVLKSCKYYIDEDNDIKWLN